jgi:RNA polymerase sigma factor (sigma-70 family)
MARNGVGTMVRDYRTLDRLGAIGDHTDAELLEVFVHGSREEREMAFAAIIERHGPMVLRVCGDILKDHHDAQDAAQSTFLVLATRAGAIRRRSSLGAWLFGVARRVSARALSAAARRRRMEQLARRESEATEPDGFRAECAGATYEELDRLPSRYRTAIVACDLEGMPHAEAVSRLGLPLRTLQTRLYRGRERLRSRLVRRGVTLGTAGLLAAVDRPASAAISGEWIEATSRAALCVGEGTAAHAAGLASDRALAWAGAGSRARTALRVALAVAALFTGGLLLGGFQAPESRNHPDPQEGPAAAQSPAAHTQTDRQLVRPLPAPVELWRILREAAQEALQIAKAKPDPHSWTLAHIASAQAKSGDLSGARATFAVAVEQARGKDYQPNLSTLRYIGYAQAECGMNEEARGTLRKAVDTVPQATGDFNQDHFTIILLSEAIQSQARTGDREGARETAARLDRFVDEVLKASRIGNADAVILPEVAGAHAATGDYDGAFATLERLRTGGRGRGSTLGDALGKILAGTRYLKPLEARRFVKRVAAELEPIKDAARTSFVLGDLADAQARLGDIEAARRSALAIGEGHRPAGDDMTNNQPYALLRVAMTQKEAGDLAGARETLRLAYESVHKHPKMSGASGRLFQVASGQVAVGDIDGAIRSAAGIEKGQKAETLGTIALAQAIAGRVEEAWATLKQAIEDAQYGREHSPASQVTPPSGPGFKTMPASDKRAVVLAMLQSMAGELDQALATARSIGDENWKRWALGAVVKSRAQAGDLREALRLSRGLESPDDRRASLEALATGLSDRLELERGIAPSR